MRAEQKLLCADDDNIYCYADFFKIWIEFRWTILIYFKIFSRFFHCDSIKSKNSEFRLSYILTRFAIVILNMKWVSERVFVAVVVGDPCEMKSKCRLPLTSNHTYLYWICLELIGIFWISSFNESLLCVRSVPMHVSAFPIWHKVRSVTSSYFTHFNELFIDELALFLKTFFWNFRRADECLPIA